MRKDLDGKVLTPGPVRNSEIETSLNEVMKARMKCRDHAGAHIRKTTVKNVLRGALAETDRRFLDRKVERGKARADHPHP